MAATIDFLTTLDDPRFFQIYEGLSDKGFGPLDGEIAKLLKFRPQAIRKLPLEQRAKHAKAILQRTNNAELCYEVFGTYLMRQHEGLVTGFLDAVGIEHDEGIVEDTSQLPSADKIPAAVQKLDGEFPPADVTMYLAVSAQTWPEVEAFDELWRDRV